MGGELFSHASVQISDLFSLFVVLLNGKPLLKFKNLLASMHTGPIPSCAALLIPSAEF